MTVLRLIADDLTGALDAVAPFAAAESPVEVRWVRPPQLAPGRSLALDLETRDLAPAAAEARSREAAPVLKGADVAFKKVDSVLRGHPAREIAGAWSGGGFRSLVVALAFPAQGRVTRDGRQWVHELDGTWRKVPVDLLSDLRSLDLPIELVPEEGRPEGAGAFFCEATSEEALARIVDAGRTLRPPVLWCGTGGLARALAGPPRPRPRRVWELPWLGLVGTAHPVMTRQIDELAAARPDAVVAVASTDDAAIEQALDAVANALEDGHGRLLALRLPARVDRLTAATAIERMAKLGTVRLPRPGTLLVSGGETLVRLCRAEGADSLVVTGEHSPGVAIAELVHGPWSGIRVVTKSGGFGAPGLVLDIIESIERGSDGGR